MKTKLAWQKVAPVKDNTSKDKWQTMRKFLQPVEHVMVNHLQNKNTC